MTADGLCGSSCQDRLLLDRRELFVRNARQHNVLPGREADFAVAIPISQVSDGPHLRRRDPADGHEQADIVEARLLLRMDSQMIGVAGRALIDAGRAQRSSPAAFNFVAKPIDAAVFDEKGEPARLRASRDP